MITHPFGDRAVLVEIPPDVSPADVAAALAAADEVVEAVPAARTVLVEFRPGAAGSVADLLTDRPPVATAPNTLVEIPVVYDGPDLHSIADHAGLSVEEVVSRHAAGAYTVAFCGFAPGFAYLTGLHPTLHTPRLDEPRTRVPAGSVGVAGEFTGVYPRSSPGGWRLLGRTDAVLWDTRRTPPALLPPGTAVRFIPR